MAEELNIANKSFLGRGWSFPPYFSKAQQTVYTTADEDDIRYSLEILLSTAIGERFLQPDYGCNLDAYVFEAMNATVQTSIKLTVKNAIQLYETRINLLSIELGLGSLNEGRVDIIIDYAVANTNSRFNLVYPFYLSEANNKKA